MNKAITEANTLGDRSDLRRIVERVLDMPSAGRASSCELATTILDALTPALSQPSQEPISIDPAAVDALKNHQRQLDADGVFVGVSREALDMVLAALSQPSHEISIKPLEWLEGSWGRELAYGIDGKYAYEVRGPFDGRSAYWMHQGAGLKMVDVETIEAAKAAAQKDFEARIRSALAPPAVPGEVHAQLALIKHLAEYTTEKNWDDKRLYIMQAVDRALSAPLPAIEGGDKGDGGRRE